MTRRSLLGAVPGALLSSAHAAKPLSIGFVTEPGGSHLSLLVKGISKCGGIGSVAIADPSGESFATVRDWLGRYGGALRTFKGHTEMIQSTAPDLTVITVEARHNPAIVEAALAANSHVMCEKPPCLHLSQFESMAARARSSRRQLMMAMATRANPGAREAHGLIERGWLGKIYGVTMTWVGDQSRLKTRAWQTLWVSYKDRAGGGKLAFHGIHYLDLIHYITGDSIARVTGFCRNVGGQPVEVEDAAVVAFQFRGGVLGTLNTGYYLDSGNSNFIQIWGEKGWVRFDPFEPLRWYSTHPAAPRGEQVSTKTSPDDDYDVMMAEAVRTAAGGAPFMTTDDSLDLMRVIFAAYRASETGQAQKTS
jgi:predicted dehydrogenase